MNWRVPWLVRPLQLEGLSHLEAQITHEFEEHIYRISYIGCKKKSVKAPVEHCVFIDVGWMP
jgi:hypothetical protein